MSTVTNTNSTYVLNLPDLDKRSDKPACRTREYKIVSSSSLMISYSDPLISFVEVILVAEHKDRLHIYTDTKSFKKNAIVVMNFLFAL